MSPLRVYTYTNIKRCSCFAQLHILSFYRIEVDKSCHLYVYIHTPTSNVACTLLHTLSFYRIEADKVCHLCVCIHTLTSNVVCTLRNDIFCHSTNQGRQVTCTSVILQTRGWKVCHLYAYVLQNRGRQVMSPPRVYTYTNIKRCLYFAQWHTLPFYRIEVDKSCHLYSSIPAHGDCEIETALDFTLKIGFLCHEWYKRPTEETYFA
jgi:hypothetical protein